MIEFPAVEVTDEKNAEKAWQAALPVPMETARALQKSTELLDNYLNRMGALLEHVMRRMDQMENQMRAATVTHEEVKGLTRLIRNRAAELCEKYALDGAKDAQAIRAAIKKDLLKLYLVKDLHDLPAIARPGCEDRIRAWSNMRLIMSRRGIGSG